MKMKDKNKCNHCWEMSPIVFTIDPPKYERFCKHCGKIEIGRYETIWR